MGSVTIRHKVNYAAVHAMLQSPHGGLARDMLKRAVRVQAKARTNLQRPPTRVRTGLLRASIGIEPIYFNGYPGFRIGSNLKYALFVHNGTGLFGPEHHYIVPKHGKVLVFTPEGQLVPVFARRVKGMPPNPFLKDALPAART